MLISVDEAAKRLKISNRAVQIKCKKQGVLKIGNQYQLTDEIAQRWYDSENKTKRNEQEVSRDVSYAKRKKSVSVEQPVIIIILIAIITILTCVYIFDLRHQNETKDKIITDKEKIIIVKDSELKTINNQLDDSVKVINKLRQQNRDLKYKDSMRIFKP